MYILKEEDSWVGYTWVNCKVYMDKVGFDTTRDKGLYSYVKRKGV